MNKYISNKNSMLPKALIWILGTFIHLQLIYSYFINNGWNVYPETWTYLSNVLIIIFLLLFWIMTTINRKLLRIYILFFRIAMSLILMIPERENLFGYCLLISLLIFECFSYFSFGSGWFVFFVYTTYIILLSKKNISLWSVPLPFPNFQHTFMVLTFLTIFTILSYYICKEQKNHEITIAEIKGLLNSNELLASANVSLQTMVVQEKEITLQQERSRISREIHDTVACTLINSLSILDAYRISLQTHTIHGSIEPIADACKLIRQGFIDIRKVLSDLRREDTGSNFGLNAIKDLIDVFRKAARVNITLSFGDIPAFPGKDIEEVLYRVVQEGLTNAIRHGKATQILVSFHLQHYGIELTVKDNGVGALTSVNNGFGLIGISERVHNLHGSVYTFSEPDKGFLLRIWVPLKESCREDK